MIEAPRGSTTFGDCKVAISKSDIALLALLKGMMGYLKKGTYRPVTNMDVIRKIDPGFCLVGGRRNGPDITRALRTGGLKLAQKLLGELTVMF